MSTLTVSNITTGDTTISGTLSVNGNTTISNVLTVSGALTASAIVPSSSFQRNRIINGAMDIWQRGTSFPNSGSTTYTADRFLPSLTGVLVNVTQDSSVPNNEFKYSLKMVPASNATATECVMRQWIEQSNLYDFTGKTVTASVWVNCSKSSVRFRVAAFNATNGGDGIVNISVTPGVWTRITQSFTSFATVTAWTSTPNAAGAFFDVGFVNGTALTTSDYFFMTGAQVEVGTAATPFERRQFGTELMLCQRYYIATSSEITAFKRAYNWSGTFLAINVAADFPVTMRTAPTMVVFGDISDGARTNLGTAGLSSSNYGFTAYTNVNNGAFLDFHYYTASAEF